MDTTTLVDRYQQASSETRNQIDVLLEQDADDDAWSDQLGAVYRQVDVARLLRKTASAVSQDRRLLRLDMRSGIPGYPVFQFEGRALVPGVGEVVRLLTPVVETTWTIASWLTSPLPALDRRRPIDALRDGRRDAVTSAARDFAATLAR